MQMRLEFRKNMGGRVGKIYGNIMYHHGQRWNQPNSIYLQYIANNGYKQIR